MEKKENYSFPSEKELKEIREKVSKPNYPYRNKILPLNASAEEKSKYQICQAILVHQQENNLSIEEVANQLNLDKNATAKLLRGYTENFTLGELIRILGKIYSSELLISEGKTLPVNSFTSLLEGIFKELKITPSEKTIKEIEKLRILSNFHKLEDE